MKTKLDNVNYEIGHADLVRALAKQLKIEPDQITVVPLSEEENSAVKAVVRTDLATANKIDRKLKRLDEGGEPEPVAEG